MPFAYYAKLSPARQRIYRRSDTIETLSLPVGVMAGEIVAGIRDGLAGEEEGRRPRRAVVVDVEHRNTGQAHPVNGSLSGGGVAIDVTGVDLLNIGIGQARVVERAEAVERLRVLALDDRPPGLRWLELHADGRIETEVAWVPKAG